MHIVHHFMAYVAPPVGLRSAKLDKSLVTHTAHKGFMTSMQTLRRFQANSLAKSLTAHITFQWFVSSVDSLISVQVILLCKSTGAHILSGFVCVPFIISVTMVTNTSVKAGGLSMHQLQLLPMKRSHVNFQTAELNKGS